MHHRSILSLMFLKYGVWQLNQVWYKTFILCYIPFPLYSSGLYDPSRVTYNIYFLLYFSFYALCGLSDCSGFHTGLPFCTKMWAHKCASFHRHLFIDGFSLGKLLQGMIIIVHSCHSVLTSSLFKLWCSPPEQRNLPESIMYF